MRKTFLGFLTALLFCTVGALTASAAVVGTNGSFETGTVSSSYATLTAPDSTSISGWSVTTGSVDYINGLWSASDGARSIDLNGMQAGTVAQTLATSPGSTYVVYFDLSGNPDTRPVGDALWSPSKKVVAVQATGATAKNYSYNTAGMGNTRADMRWVPQTYTFVATATSTTLSFKSTVQGAFGPAIDNVVIQEILRPTIRVQW